MSLPRQGNIPSQNMSKYFTQTPIKNFINTDKCIPGKNAISVFHSHHEWSNSYYCLVLTSNINYSVHTSEGKENVITFLYRFSLHSHQNFIWAIHMPWAHLCAPGTQASGSFESCFSFVCSLEGNNCSSHIYLWKVSRRRTNSVYHIK